VLDRRLAIGEIIEMANPRVALFVTCLVDLFRPSVGFATVKLLEDAGCTVEVPRQQTCCGQPAYNSGDKADTKAIARQVIEAFEGYDYTVAPSGTGAKTGRANPRVGLILDRRDGRRGGGEPVRRRGHLP
jgi:Fe-S oxidoreductase